MKPLSVEMACLLGIQNEVQAVCFIISSVEFVVKVGRCSKCPNWKFYCNNLEVLQS